jgi:hypothetical protein
LVSQYVHNVTMNMINKRWALLTFIPSLQIHKFYPQAAKRYSAEF